MQITCNCGHIVDSDKVEVYSHRIMVGDATKKEDVDKLMNGKKADLIFVDPPYNVAYEGGGGYAEHGTPKREMIMNDEMSDEDFYKFLYKALKNLIDVCDGIFYVCMSSKELPNLKKSFEEAGGHWQSFIIWVKNRFTLTRSDYQNQYEPIMYGWNKLTLNHYFMNDRSKPNVWEGFEGIAKYDGKYTEINIAGQLLRIEGRVKGYIQKGRNKVDIWRFNNPPKSEEHPTMKPIALCAEAIKNSSSPTQLVVDTFLGSGSTMVAAHQMNRVCFGMELDPKYADVSIARMIKQDPQLKLYKDGNEIDKSKFYTENTNTI